MKKAIDPLDRYSCFRILLSILDIDYLVALVFFFIWCIRYY